MVDAMSHDTQDYATPRTPPRVLSVSDTAAVLAISKRGVYRLVEQGMLRPSRVGRRLRFRLSDLDEYLERTRGAP